MKRKRTNRYLFPIALILVLAFPYQGKAQNNSDRLKPNNAISLYGGAGITMQSSQLFMEQRDFYPNYVVGLQWRPNHQLFMELESGFVTIGRESLAVDSTGFGMTDYKASLSAVPLLLVFTMRIKGIDLSGGAGISKVYSTIEAFNTPMKANRWFYTYYVAVGHSFQFKRFCIQPRANLYSFSKLDKTIVGVSLITSYDFYSR
jgi:hypothetical protein